jgi:DNA-binding NarL/FixJ family response regulator
VPQPLTRLLYEQADRSDDLSRLEVIVGGPAVFSKIRHVAAATQFEALSLEPPQVRLPPSENRAADAVDRQLMRRGVRQRNVISDVLEARSDTEILKELASAGSPTRCSAVPMRVQIYDRRIAFFALAAEDTRRGAYVTTAPTLVQIACRLFEEVWARAQVPAALAHLNRGDPAMDEKRLRVLHLLADGYTDERIARRMGVSTRAVVRVVAQLQDDLGAKSRFQLALAAQRAGLIDGGATGRDSSDGNRLSLARTP